LISFGKFKVLDKIGCAAAGREGWRTFPFFFFLSLAGLLLTSTFFYFIFRLFGPMMTEHTASLLELYLGV
jgi:hypothetical protein